MPTYASNQTKKREFFEGGRGGSFASKGVRSLHRDFKGGSSEPLKPPSYTPAPVVYTGQGVSKDVFGRSDGTNPGFGFEGFKTFWLFQGKKKAQIPSGWF